MNKRIVVVGAGIVGASVAYHLAGKGAQVTVVDAGEVAGGVTATSFAWIHSSHTAPDPIAQLRSTAITEYRRLQAQLPCLEVRWNGALSCGESAIGPDSQPLATLVGQARILELEPNLKHPPEQAVFVAEEGAVDAVQATHALIAAAQALGATLLTHTPVLALATRDAKVTGVETATGIIEADVVVLAAGTGIKALAEALEVPLPIEASPSVFIRYAAPCGLVNGIFSSPDMEIRQDAEGTLLAAEDYLDDAPHNQPGAIALRTAKVIGQQLHGVDFIEPHLACIGLRPIAADRLPVIGYLPTVQGVYVCTMHPGVALAAAVGRLTSEEIIDHTLSPALAPCRPDRFLQGSKAC